MSTNPPRRPAEAARVPASILFTLAALLFVALNLRLALAGIGPVLDGVRIDLDMSRGAAALLTTLPLICFGLLAPASAYLGSRLGNEAALLASLAVLTVGIVVRSLGGSSTVLLGTVLLGAGIAVGNVLVPVLVKSHLSSMIGVAMGLYTAFLTGGAALGAAGTAGLAAIGSGWRLALGVAAVPAAAALVVFGIWTMFHLRSQLPATAAPPGVPARVWKAGTAWQLAFLMGGQSLLFYSVLAWLPALLQDRGVSVAESGAMLSLYTVLGIIGALVVPPLAARGPDQRAVAVATVVGWSIGLTGLWIFPAWYVVWTVELGVTQGAGIAMALTLIVLRARDTVAARQLSGMVQMVGYLLAAVGPWLVGALRDQTGTWSWSLVALIAVSLGLIGAAWRVGRAEPVG